MCADRRMLWFGVGVTLLGSLASAASASTYIIDQENESFNQGWRMTVVQAGQQFVPSLSSLDTVEVFIWDASISGSDPADVLVNIRRDSLEGDILGTSRVTTVPTDHDDWVRFGFDSPAVLNPGQTYVIEPVLQNTGSLEYGLGCYYNGDPYPAGDGLIDVPAGDPFDLAFREGSHTQTAGLSPLHDIEAVSDDQVNWLVSDGDHSMQIAEFSAGVPDRYRHGLMEFQVADLPPGAQPQSAQLALLVSCLTHYTDPLGNERWPAVGVYAFPGNGLADSTGIMEGSLVGQTGDITECEEIVVDLDWDVMEGLISADGWLGLELRSLRNGVWASFDTLESFWPGSPAPELLVDYVPEYATPGDANRDGHAFLGDLCILAGNWNQSGKTWSEGDFNGDRIVSVGDLCLLAGNWRWGVPASAPIPEPATLSLLMLGGIGLLGRRSR